MVIFERLVLICKRANESIASIPFAKALLSTMLLCELSQSSMVWAADDALILRNKYQSLAQLLSNNQFKRPLHLDSEESSSTIKGDIYAVVDYPFSVINNSLNDTKLGPANWCDVLILHINTKYCHASTNGSGSTLIVNIGQKSEQALGDTYQVVFNYRVMATSAEYFQVDLNADTGPLGTKDYRIALEAVSIDAKHTFIHLTYAYGYGITGRIAMKTYLSTIGLGKVGFTTIDDQSSIKTDAPIEYIGGVRGLIERNTIRYYLAIDAFLSALSTVPDKRLEQRLTRWFNGTDQYPRQLHEMERPEYMAMKYKEYQRQQMAQ